MQLYRLMWAEREHAEEARANRKHRGLAAAFW